MITQHDLDTAIAECQGKRNPDANTCIKLAAFYTIRREMFGQDQPQADYSYAPPPETTIELDSDTAFAQQISGKDSRDILPVIDELMTTLQIIMPKLYNAVMRRLP